MKITAELCVIPIGSDTSLSGYVAECERVLSQAGLATDLHAYGTNVEGEWDEVFSAFKRCHQRVHEMGGERVFTVIKVGSRVDREQSISDKVESVREKL